MVKKFIVSPVIMGFILFLALISSALADNYSPGEIGLDFGGHINLNFTHMWKGYGEDCYRENNPYGDTVFGFGPDIRYRPGNWLFGVDFFYNYGHYTNHEYDIEKTSYNDIMIGGLFTYYPHNRFGFSAMGGYARLKISSDVTPIDQYSKPRKSAASGFYVGGEGEFFMKKGLLGATVSLRYAQAISTIHTEYGDNKSNLGGLFLSFGLRSHI